MARKGNREHWTGGRVFIAPDGKRTFVIERMWAGKRRAITLSVTNEQEAQAEFALYLRDPGGYQTPQQLHRDRLKRFETEALPITQELIDELVSDLTARGRSAKYTRWTVRTYLRQWMEILNGKSLKDVTLAELQRHLKRKAGVRQRIVALKTLTHFLRRAGRLRPNEDPTLALQLPAIRPEKSRHEKGHTMEEVATIYRLIKAQEIRDYVMLRARTGMHGSEIERIARGDGTIRVLDGHGEIAGTVSFGHKVGHTHVNSLTADALAAALRLQARGSAPVLTWTRAHIIGVAKKAGVAPITCGALRHSFVNWCFEHGREVRAKGTGVPLQAIAATIGHRNVNTTTKFYLGNQVIPPLIVTPLVLTHPDDPPVEQSGSRGSAPAPEKKSA